MWQLPTALLEGSEAIIKGEGEIWKLKGHVAGYKERQTCLQAPAECDEAGKAPQAERTALEKKAETGTWEQVQEAWVAVLLEDWDPEMLGGHIQKSSKNGDEECSMALIPSQMVPQEP